MPANKHKKRNLKQIKPKLLLLIFVLFIVALFGVLDYFYFLAPKEIKFSIDNSYYGFKIKTPDNWIAITKSIYSQENMDQIFSECQADKSDNGSFYEIGKFKFEDQRYPENFGDLGYYSANLPSGGVLGITVNCIPASAKNRFISFGADLRVAGERALMSFLDLPELGKTNSITFIHNGFQFVINEYTYVSSADNAKAAGIKAKYSDSFKKIVSSIEFTK